jgi:crossover junction endodeoxyribonuclease RuvC
MFTILGIDPGSACTGWGLVRGTGDNIEYAASGVIRPERKAQRYERVKEIFLAVNRVIQEHQPTHFAVEDVFFCKNPKSALVLGEARGAAVLAASLAGLSVFEYSPREIKQALTGHGGAAKSQVAYMLQKILVLPELPERDDESDALAVAVCHAFRQREWSVT